jgi:hypothetical protein
MLNKIIGGPIMRKLIYVIVLSLGCGSLFAHKGSEVSRYSDLNIRMWDNSSFMITLDHGISQQTRSFNLQHISPGSHYVKIVKRKKNQYGHGGFVKTIYEGRLNLPAKRKVVVKVEGRNRLSYKFFKKVDQHHHNNRSGNHNSYQNSGHHHQNTTGGNYGSASYGINSYSDFESNASDCGNYGQSNFRNNYSSSVMNENRFNRLMEEVRKEHFDKDRLVIAIQALASNHITVNQVSVIMDEFSFDKSKLNFAKAAYNKTVDRENYFVIN